MRVLQLHDVQGGAPVELHAQITVVRGGDPVRRAWLVSTLGRLPSGGDLEAQGTVDVGGIRFGVDAASLALLSLDEPVRSVVVPADLPGHDAALEAARRALADTDRRRREQTDELDRLRAALADAVAARDRAKQAVEEIGRGEGPARDALAAAGAERSRMAFELKGARDELARAETALADAVAARDALVQSHDALQARIETARERRRAVMEDAVAAAAAREAHQVNAPADDADPEAALDAARQELARAEAAVADGDPDRDDSPLSRQIEALDRRRVELVQRQVALGETSTSEVSSALAALTAAPEGGAPVVAALALADTWRDLHQQIGALDAGVSPAERAAEERVHAARRAVVEAEAQFNQPVLTPEQIEKVEAAHTAVLEAQDRSDGRFGRARAQKKLDDLRADERRVLERLGFSTYADYMMSSSSRGVGQANRGIAESVRGQLEDAQAALQAIPGASDRARRRSELLQRKDDVAPKIAELLGHEPTGPEAEDELRGLRQAPGDRTAEQRDLARALGGVGLEVGPEPWDPDDLILLARSYLSEDRAAAGEREDLAAALPALERTLRDLRDARQRGVIDPGDLSHLPTMAQVDGDDTAAPEAGPGLWSARDDARDAVTAAEAALRRHRDWHDRLGALTGDLDEAGRRDAEAAAALAATEAEAAQDHPARVQAAAEVVAAAEADLARARATESDIGQRITDRSGTSSVDELTAEATRRLAECEVEVTVAAEREQEAAEALSTTEAARAGLEADVAAAGDRTDAVDRKELLADVDWELLARLAQVRTVGLAGSVPLVLDDPFPVLLDDEIPGVLDRLVRMAQTVQIVVASDRPAVLAWADGLGPDRALVVTP